ncbi:hypothetical protein E4U19_005546 [Claviceps sp. Clav32 group G5]|nr:hypothetical protein E4U19_005546 [Claviceps sp. Clav32 group G5]
MRKEEMRSRPAPRVPLTNGAFDNDQEERPCGEGRKGGKGGVWERRRSRNKQMRMQDRNLAGPCRQKTMADRAVQDGEEPDEIVQDVRIPDAAWLDVGLSGCWSFVWLSLGSWNGGGVWDHNRYGAIEAT